MDELYSEVANALDGLVIPPLLDVINEFVPNRAILSSNNLLAKFDGNDLTVRVHDYGTLSVIRVSGSWHYATFSGAHPEGSFILDFSRIWPEIEKMDPVRRWHCDSAEVVYEGETEVIRIF